MPLHDWTDDPHRRSWSNQRMDVVPRGGVAWVAMTDAQHAAAQVSSQRIDLVLGPREDGATFASEGHAAGDMTPEQRALLMDAITARLGPLARRRCGAPPRRH